MPCSANPIPATISAGDSFAWPVALSDYPASAGWTLHLGAACTSPVGTILLDAQASGDGYVFNVTAGTSAAWLPGRYLFALYVTGNGGQRITVSRGSLQVIPDPAATAVALDHAQRALGLIEAALEGRIPRGLEDTTIDGQQINRMPIRELHDLREKYRAEVAGIERAAAAAAGIQPRTMIYVRFRRPGGTAGHFRE